MCAKNSGVDPRSGARLTGAKFEEVPEGEDFVLFAHPAQVAPIRTVEPIPIQTPDVFAIGEVETVVLHASDVLAIGFVEAVALHSGLKGAVAQVHALARNPAGQIPPLNCTSARRQNDPRTCRCPHRSVGPLPVGR